MQDPISWRKRFSLIGRRTLIADGQFNAARPRRTRGCACYVHL